MRRTDQVEAPTAGWSVRRDPDRRFALGVVVVFLLVGAFAAWHHEVWSDEFSSWLIARDARSLADLLDQSRYQGHPPLWVLLLTPLAKLTRSATAMQVLNLALAAGSAYLVASRAPFPRTHRVLLVSSYYLLFEYALIPRTYTVEILLLFLFCTLFAGRSPRLAAAGATLGLLALANVYGVMLAVAGASAVVVDSRLSGSRFAGRRLGAFLGLTALGVVLSVASLLPKPDYAFGGPWRFGLDPERLGRVLQLLPHAFLPYPSTDVRAWWQVFHAPDPLGAWGVPLALALLLSVVALLLARPAALAAFLVATGGMLAFSYMKFFGYVRQHGLLFVALVAALWLAAAGTPRPLGRLRRVPAAVARALPLVFGGILLAQSAAAAKAIWMDVRLPFSNGKRTAELIREAGLADLPMVGEWDHAVSTVVGYLQKDYAYWPRSERRGSFVRWDTARRAGFIPLPEILRYASAVACEEGSDVLVVLNSRLPPRWVARQPAISEVGRAEGALLPYEDFFVYRLALDGACAGDGGEAASRGG